MARPLRARQLQPPRPLRQADPSREGLPSAGRLLRGESDRCAPLWRNAGAAHPATVNAALRQRGDAIWGGHDIFVNFGTLGLREIVQIHPAKLNVV